MMAIKSIQKWGLVISYIFGLILSLWFVKLADSVIPESNTFNLYIWNAVLSFWPITICLLISVLYQSAKSPDWVLFLLLFFSVLSLLFSVSSHTELRAFISSGSHIVILLLCIIRIVSMTVIGRKQPIHPS